MRARRSFGNRDDDRFPRPRLVVTQRHAAHPQIDRELLLVYGKERQIHSLEIALPNGGRGQLHASGVHTRRSTSDGRDSMGGGENETVGQIYAPSGSPRRWVLPDVDRIEAQRVVGGAGRFDGLGVVGGLGMIGGLRAVGGLGVRVPEQHQSHHWLASTLQSHGARVGLSKRVSPANARWGTKPLCQMIFRQTAGRQSGLASAVFENIDYFGFVLPK